MPRQNAKEEEPKQGEKFLLSWIHAGFGPGRNTDRCLLCCWCSTGRRSVSLRHTIVLPRQCCEIQEFHHRCFPLDCGTDRVLHEAFTFKYQMVQTALNYELRSPVETTDSLFKSPKSITSHGYRFYTTPSHYGRGCDCPVVVT